MTTRPRIEVGSMSVTKPELVLSIGTFDGVHVGHRHLVQQTMRRARELGCLSGAITFHPHPRAVVTGRGPSSLTALDERLALLNGLGLDVVIALPFTQELARLPALDFMALLSQSVCLRELWVGADFALGHRREGTVARLSEIGRDLGFVVHGVPPFVLHGQTVSSTLIRDLIERGWVETAARLLGRRYHVGGIAISAAEQDRHSSVCTSIVVNTDGLAVPAEGAYVVRVRTRNRQWPATARVEFDLGSMPQLMASVPTLAGDLRGQSLLVEFVRRLWPGERGRLASGSMGKVQEQRRVLSSA